MVTKSYVDNSTDRVNNVNEVTANTHKAKMEKWKAHYPASLEL